MKKTRRRSRSQPAAPDQIPRRQWTMAGRRWRWCLFRRSPPPLPPCRVSERAKVFGPFNLIINKTRSYEQLLHTQHTLANLLLHFSLLRVCFFFFFLSYNLQSFWRTRHVDQLPPSILDPTVWKIWDESERCYFFVIIYPNPISTKRLESKNKIYKVKQSRLITSKYEVCLF